MTSVASGRAEWPPTLRVVSLSTSWCTSNLQDAKGPRPRPLQRSHAPGGRDLPPDSRRAQFDRPDGHGSGGALPTSAGGRAAADSRARPLSQAANDQIVHGQLNQRARIAAPAPRSRRRRDGPRPTRTTWAQPAAALDDAGAGFGGPRSPGTDELRGPREQVPTRPPARPPDRRDRCGRPSRPRQSARADA